MGKAESHGRRRGADVQHRHRALELVMPRLVEEVAESDHTGCFPGEIHRQASCAAGEHARDRVQFLAAVPQIVSGYNEIGSAECGIGSEQKAIFTIPKSMAGSLRNAHWMYRC